MKKISLSIKLLAGITVLLFLVTSAQAVTVVLTPEKDCYMHGVQYTWFWRWWWQSGNDNKLKVGRWYTSLYELEDRILIYFNLSSIPKNAKIESAELRLYYTCGSNDQNDKYQICRLTEDWNEYYLNRSWIYSRNRPLHVCSGIKSSVPSSSGWMTWNITNDVKGFVNGSYKNYGWVVKFYSSDGWSYFKSREASNNQPQLIIRYTIPQTSVPELTPVGLVLLVGGLIALSIRKFLK